MYSYHSIIYIPELRQNSSRSDNVGSVTSIAVSDIFPAGYGAKTVPFALKTQSASVIIAIETRELTQEVIRAYSHVQSSCYAEALLSKMTREFIYFIFSYKHWLRL